MMRVSRGIGVLAVALVAVSAYAAGSASAAMFRGTASLKGEQTTTQVLTTGAGTMTCTGASSSNPVSETEIPAQEISVQFSGCTAFGFIGVEISEAKFLFNANGTVTVLNTITVDVPFAGCSVTVSPQGPLGTISYKNKSGKIEEITNVSGIKSQGSGGLCGGESSAGTYTGNSLIELVGGSIEWVE